MPVTWSMYFDELREYDKLVPANRASKRKAAREGRRKKARR